MSAGEPSTGHAASPLPGEGGILRAPAHLAADETESTSAHPGWLRQLAGQPVALLCAVLLLTIGIAAAFAPFFAPYDPVALDPSQRLQGPSAAHWLGTDPLGRDVLSRIIYGARPALGAAVVAVILAAAIGISLGLFAGYRGGNWDRLVMRAMDMFQAIPTLVFIFAIIAVIGRGIVPATLAVAFLFSIIYIRITRGIVLRERERLYVDAARVAGLSERRIVFSEILPNLSGPLIVETALLLGSAQLIIAMLSFLGLGVDADAPDWGGMLNEARLYQSIQPFLAIPSGLAITGSVLLFNLLGDSLRDIATGHDERKHGARGWRVAASPERVATSAANENALLAVDGLSVEFPHGDREGMHILDDVSFALNRGETFGLVGESGSGKSMTALALLGLVPPPGLVTRGTVRLDGEDLLALPDKELAARRGRDIAMIFQDPVAAFSPVHTIGEQITRPLRTHWGLSKRDARERGIALLERVGVVDPAQRFDDYPHQFSGGMAQRAMIAMALSCEPKVLLADEPTTALDVTVQAQVLDLLMELKDDFGMSILLVTHDLGVIAETCDRIGVMYAGQMVETGDVEAVFAAPGHPYTRALLEATPRGEDRQQPLAAIPGRVPPPWDWPRGCRFHPRCGFAEDACREREIAMAGGSRCRRRDELFRRAAS